MTEGLNQFLAGIGDFHLEDDNELTLSLNNTPSGGTYELFNKSSPQVIEKGRYVISIGGDCQLILSSYNGGTKIYNISINITKP